MTAGRSGTDPAGGPGGGALQRRHDRQDSGTDGQAEAASFSGRKHAGEKLTLFLRKAGAPLDNNICEQALKKAILHRKNALFYKTDNGAVCAAVSK